MLKQFGVRPRMKKWLMWCVKTATMSIMVNGCSTDPVNLEKGLRQGDLISTFLFIMVSESLTFITHQAQNLGLISGIPIGNDNVVLTHLQFADDTLLFIPKDSSKLINYKRLLSCFSLMTGLNLNLSKSWLGGVLTMFGFNRWPLCWVIR